MGTATIDQGGPLCDHPNPWMDGLAEPALLTAMVACLSLAANSLIAAVAPSLGGPFLVAGMVFVSLEAIGSFRILGRHRHIREKRLRFRLAEWSVLVIFVKILTYLGKPLSVIVADIKSWFVDPVCFLTLDYLVYLLMAVAFWQITTNTIRAFDRLFDLSERLVRPLERPRPIIHRFYQGGVLLMLMCGAAQWWAKPGAQAESGFSAFLSVIVYFALGLVLLSRTHLSFHLAKWRREQLDVSPILARRWAVYGLTALGLMILTALLLPTGYTLGFLTSIKAMLALIYQGIVWLTTFIWSLLFLCLKWLLSLFGIEEAAKESVFERKVFEAEPGAIAATPEQTFYSYIFWVVVLVVFIYLFKTYLKDHPGLVDWLAKIRLRYGGLNWLGKIWRWLKGQFRSALEMRPGSVMADVRSTGPATRLKHRWPRMSMLSARERILYYYLKTLRQARKKGLKRRKDQTPKEFGVTLHQNIADADADIEALTERFVHARYSRDIVDSRQVSEAKASWQRLRKALKKKR